MNLDAVILGLLCMVCYILGQVQRDVRALKERKEKPQP